ncbi:aspartate--tRNA ligase dps1 [Serendipita sp. 397]|nr:aspartate--tRNA ligase dps1 [Serendipita sp. 397]
MSEEQPQKQVENVAGPSQEAPEGAAGPSKSALKKQAKEEEKAKKAAERKRKEDEAKAARAAADSVDVSSGSYGILPLHQSQDDTPMLPLKRLATVGSGDVGKTVSFRARLASLRQQGSKLLFCEFRQSIVSIQGLLELNENDSGKPLVSKQMMRFCSSSIPESLVLIEGVIQAVDRPIQATTIKNFEVHISKVRPSHNTFRSLL